MHTLATYDDLTVGQEASFTKTITRHDVDRFVELTADANPLHTDPAFAARTFFGRPIAHGMLSASLFSTVVGMFLPGTGAIYRSQSLDFLKPVYPGDTLTATFRVAAVDREAERIDLDGRIDNQRGECVVTGTAVVSLLRRLVDG